MRNVFLSLALVLVVCGSGMVHAGKAQAFLLGRVDGHTVAYSTGQTYVVDSSFEYIGSFTSESNTTAVNQLKQDANLLVNEVFGKRHNDTNELVMIFIGQWMKLPNRWRVSEPGPMPEKLYGFKPTRFTGLADFLNSKGYTFSTDFYGGLLKGNGYLDTYTKYYFAVANTIIPTGAENNDYVRTAFHDNIKLAQ